MVTRQSNVRVEASGGDGGGGSTQMGTAEGLTEQDNGRESYGSSRDGVQGMPASIREGKT